MFDLYDFDYEPELPEIADDTVFVGDWFVDWFELVEA